MENKRLLDICDVYQPHTISRKTFESGGRYAVYGANGIVGYHSEFNHKDSEVVLGCRGACGTVHITIPQSWISGNAMVIHPNGNYPLNLKYLALSLKAANKRAIISGTAQPQITRTGMSNFYIPVCTLDEQERIVARIEELFSQLDASVSELKTAKERLKVYRQAVLKKAFEGTLTKSEQLGYSTLGTYIEKPRYGTSKKCNYSCNNKSIAVYRIPNIDHTIGQISHKDIKYAEFSETELADLILNCGDILIIRSNGSVSLVGRAALVRNNDTMGTFAGYLMRLRMKDEVLLNPKYLLYFLQSHEARVYIENKAKSTSGVHNINSSEISSLKIPVFKMDDQQSIINAIEFRLSVCDSIEKTVDTALQQAEALRQSILKKVFEGEVL